MEYNFLLNPDLMELDIGNIFFLFVNKYNNQELFHKQYISLYHLDLDTILHYILYILLL